jgi:uncharacterized C2H2 Zn-finger protein
MRLPQHIVNSRGELKCDLCEYSTIHKFSLNRHKRTVHRHQVQFSEATGKGTGKEKSNDIYNRQTSIENSANNCAINIHKGSEYKCVKCEYIFKYKADLNRHIERRVCDRKVIPCIYCNIKLCSKHSYNEHLKKFHFND